MTDDTQQGEGMEDPVLGMMPKTLTHNGKTYVHSEEGHTGKKAQQVAHILEQLMSNPGVPMEFEMLCKNAGAKYPADVQAAVMALEMCELVDLYKRAGERKVYYYVWTEDETEET